MEKNRNRLIYDDLSEFRESIEQKDYSIPVTEDLDPLGQSSEVGGKVIPNSLCLNPMEGHDADTDGGPSALTFRRYRRYAEGGAGIIWVEATAVSEKGKGHPRELILSEESLAGFAQLNREIKKHARKFHGDGPGPLTVIQLTHSGRHAAPEGRPAPIIPKHSDLLDKNYDIPSDYPVVSDAELSMIKDDFVSAAALAARAGFDAVDIKACHGYLIHELLFSYENSASDYRGSFEGRTRFLREVVDEVNENIPDLIVASRLNVYDDIPYPDGWGVERSGGIKPDLTEPVQLIEDLKESGLEILNVAMSNPYYDSFLEQPFDKPLAGEDVPDRDPLEAISTNFAVTSKIGREFPDLYKVGSGTSWLRKFFPHVAAGFKREGAVDAMGAARLALANPNFASDILVEGKLDEDELCTACSFCTQMMTDGVEAGCPVHDGEIYGPIYRKGRQKARSRQRIQYG